MASKMKELRGDIYRRYTSQKRRHQKAPPGYAPFSGGKRIEGCLAKVLRPNRCYARPTMDVERN